MSVLKLIISGGGTGGHIFPAVAIARTMREINPGHMVLFVGAEGKMEMDKVPQHGFVILGLPIRGIQRKLTLSNFKVPFLLVSSIYKSWKIIRQFKPDVVVGVGGYASAALVFTAQRMGIKTLLQEQNNFPGVTNKILARRADKICVAFEGMDKFFPKEKILLTGNPIRQDIFRDMDNMEEARSFFRMNPSKKTILVIGGSLGARTINNCLLKLVPEVDRLNIQIIWQCGDTNYPVLREKVKMLEHPNVRLKPFIDRMDLAYRCADIVISRAGALSVSEITALGKPSILIPSPNVAEDHQTKNAAALSERDAAILLSDNEAEGKIVETVESLVNNESRLETLRTNLGKVFSNKEASFDIAHEILKLAGKDV